MQLIWILRVQLKSTSCCTCFNVHIKINSFPNIIHSKRPLPPKKEQHEKKLLNTTKKMFILNVGIINLEIQL